MSTSNATQKHVQYCVTYFRTVPREYATIEGHIESNLKLAFGPVVGGGDGA